MQRNLILLNIYTYLINLVFLLPVIVPFYRDELGLNFHQFLIGETVFAAVVIICEVPTGWLADIWGRKLTILAASLTALLGYACVGFADGMAQAVLGQAIIGVAVSLHSGTLNALLYDSLLACGRADECRRREGLRHGLNLYAVASGSVIGGIAYQFDHFLPVWLELGALTLALCVGLFITEPPRATRVVEKNPLYDVIETVRFTLHGHRDIGVLVILAALIFSTTKLFLWAQQPYYEALHIPEGVYGFILAGAMLCAGMAGHFGHLILPRCGGISVLTGLFVGVIAICLVAGWSLSYGGFAIMLIGPAFWGFGWPRLQETINHAVGSERRATILSCANLIIALAFIPFSLMLGWVEEQRDITTALLVQAIIVTVLGCVFSVVLNRKRQNTIVNT